MKSSQMVRHSGWWLPLLLIILAMLVVFAGGLPTRADDPEDPGERIIFATDRDGNFEIYIMNSDGSEPTRLTDSPAFEADPAGSPDGRQIAFTSARDGNLEIYLMNVYGEEAVNLTDHSAADEMPAWSPDGQTIAFVSRRDGNPEIYLMNADGSDPLNLTADPGSDMDPAWSPDGRYLAFASKRNGNFDIYVMDLEDSGRAAGEVVRLTDSTAPDILPAWSPDGSRIAFVSRRHGNDELYIMNADGSEQTRLTDDPASDIQPAWSPDGTSIAFASDRGGDTDIYIMAVDEEGEPVRLTDNEWADEQPNWIRALVLDQRAYLPIVVYGETDPPTPEPSSTPEATGTPEPSETPTTAPTATPTETPPATPTVTPPPTKVPQPSPGKELLVFNWNKPVIKADHGFPWDAPPTASANGNWVTPINYAEGTMQFRAEVSGMPTHKDMRLQFCIWQSSNTLENCSRNFDLSYNGNKAVVTWSQSVQGLWMKDGNPIDWTRPRQRYGAVIRNSDNKPVSNFSGWEWNGENPDHWYPMNLWFMAVVVEKGKSFSGWNNYIP
jgi:Tol biopolymer transport system component